MEAWVDRALKRWPNVPALYGWLRLDRRGRWLIQDEPITRWQIIETINKNYAADDHGRWYFQNGPQRGYMRLDYAPFILRVSPSDGMLVTHTGLSVTVPTAVFMDEEGGLIIATEHGPGLLIDDELDWALRSMMSGGAMISESKLLDALTLASGTKTDLQLRIGGQLLPIQRLNFADAPCVLKFARDPQP